MFGYQHEELGDRPLRLLVPAGREARPADRDAACPDPLAPPCVSDSVGLTGVRKNGRAVPVQVCLTPPPSGADAFAVRESEAAGTAYSADRRWQPRNYAG
jgi:hypothetical protein